MGVYFTSAACTLHKSYNFLSLFVHCGSHPVVERKAICGREGGDKQGLAGWELPRQLSLTDAWLYSAIQCYTALCSGRVYHALPANTNIYPHNSNLQ